MTPRVSILSLVVIGLMALPLAADTLALKSGTPSTEHSSAETREPSGFSIPMARSRPTR